MRVLIVDDEPLARRRLTRMLERIEGVEVAGEAEDGEDALQKIDRLSPDALLLDIRMPGLDGLAVARKKNLPPIIFTTAHAEHAIEAFEAAAVDYLLKPVQQTRLEEALARVRQRGSIDASELRQVLDRIASREPVQPRLVARRGDTSWLVDPGEVALLRAAEKYVVFRHEGKEYVLDESLGELEQRLAPLGFRRVHRSDLVNLNRVRAAHRTLRGVILELTDGERVHVSRRRSAEVLDALGIRER